jgi:secreted trypsin-like serine protease
VLESVLWIAPLQAINHQPSHEAREHPAVVLITARRADNRRVVYCCGVLLASKYVLTAAHCAEGCDSWGVTAPYASKPPALAHSHVARIHPAYKRGSWEHDLAVLRLESPIELAQEFPSLAGGTLLPLGTGLVVVGRNENGKLSQDRLYEARVTLSPFPSNLNVYGILPEPIAEGDSGGPVFLARKGQTLAAVISGGIGFSRGNLATGCCVPLTEKHKQWIERELRTSP